MSTTALEIRLTNKFVGPYRHLDEWAEVGTVKTLASTTTEPDAGSQDITEPRLTTMLVCVECHEPEPLEHIAKALRDTFSSAGCAHEFDCCGCRSFYVSKAEHLSDARWHVEIGSSRNY